MAVAVLGVTAGFGWGAAVQEEEEDTYLMMFSSAGNSLLGVKESFFPERWGSASLKHCLSLLWFLRPKNNPPRTNFCLPEYPAQQILERNTWAFFFSFKSLGTYSLTLFYFEIYFIFLPSWKILTDLCFSSHWKVQPSSRL